MMVDTDLKFMSHEQRPSLKDLFLQYVPNSSDNLFSSPHGSPFGSAHSFHFSNPTLFSSPSGALLFSSSSNPTLFQLDSPSSNDPNASNGYNLSNPNAFNFMTAPPPPPSLVKKEGSNPLLQLHANYSSKNWNETISSASISNLVPGTDAVMGGINLSVISAAPTESNLENDRYQEEQEDSLKVNHQYFHDSDESIPIKQRQLSPFMTHARKHSQGSEISGSEFSGYSENDPSEISDDEYFSEDVDLNRMHRSLEFSSNIPSSSPQHYPNSPQINQSSTGYPQVINFTPTLPRSLLFRQLSAERLFPVAPVFFSTGETQPQEQVAIKQEHSSPNMVLKSSPPTPSIRRHSSSAPNGGKHQRKLSGSSPRALSPIKNKPGIFIGKIDFTTPEEEQEKKAQRMLKNRRAAKEFRKKKKEYTTELEQTLQELEEQNRLLSRQLYLYKSKFGELQ